MQEKTVSFPVDADTRLIQLMRLTPMNDSLDLLPNLMKDEGDEDPDGSLSSYGSALGHGEHKAKAAYRAYRDVRKSIRDSLKPEPVRLIEFVEGGLTGIPTSEVKEL